MTSSLFISEYPHSDDKSAYARLPEQPSPNDIDNSNTILNSHNSPNNLHSVNRIIHSPFATSHYLEELF